MLPVQDMPELVFWAYQARPPRFCSRRPGNWFKRYFRLTDKGVLEAYDLADPLNPASSTPRSDCSEFVRHNPPSNSWDLRQCTFYDTTRSLDRPCSAVFVLNGPEAGRRSRRRPNMKLYLSADDLVTIDELKKELEQLHNATFGGSMERYPPTEEALDPIELKPISEWGVEEMGRFWILSGNSGLQHTMEKHALTGADLLDPQKTNYGFFRDTCDFSGETTCSLQYGVMDTTRMFSTMENGFYSKARAEVMNKMRRNWGHSSGFDAGEAFRMAGILSDPVQLKHVFLSTAGRYFYRMPPADHISEESRISPFNRTRMRVKLIVREITTRTGMSDAMDPYFRGSPHFDRSLNKLRTGVILGPWYLEWNWSGLVVPKRLVSGNAAVITADVDTLFLIREDLSTITDRLAQLLVTWNIERRYSASEQGGVLKYANSQHFVDTLFATLRPPSIPGVVFDGALDHFAEIVRREGSAELKFLPSDAFKDFFRGKEVFEHDDDLDQVILFHSHQDLDEFAEKVVRNCFDINELFPCDWLLLKAFDRAFWARHLKDPEAERYQSLPPGENDMCEFPTGCPFKDPRETI